MPLYEDAKKQWGTTVAQKMQVVIVKHGERASSPLNPPDALSAISSILESHDIPHYGIEPIREEESHKLNKAKPYIDKSYWGDTVALYINLGDTYKTTVLYDVAEDEHLVTSWGDWYEANMVDQGEKLLREAIKKELYRLDIDGAMAEAIIAKIREYSRIDYDYYAQFKTEKVKELTEGILGDFIYIPHSEKEWLLEWIGGRIVNSYYKSVVFDGEVERLYIFEQFLSDLLKD